MMVTGDATLHLDTIVPFKGRVIWRFPQAQQQGILLRSVVQRVGCAIILSSAHVMQLLEKIAAAQ
jgi:hypothetical protein